MAYNHIKLAASLATSIPFTLLPISSFAAEKETVVLQETSRVSFNIEPKDSGYYSALTCGNNRDNQPQLALDLNYLNMTSGRYFFRNTQNAYMSLPAESSCEDYKELFSRKRGLGQATKTVSENFKSMFIFGVDYICLKSTREVIEIQMDGFNDIKLTGSSEFVIGYVDMKFCE